MTATVFPERMGRIQGLAPLQNAGEFEAGFYYTGLGVDEDILEHPAIPKEKSVFKRHQVAFRVLDFTVEEYTHTSGRVGVRYSSGANRVTFLNNYIRWEMTYKKVPINVPTFVVRTDFYTPANSADMRTLWSWEEQGWKLDIEYSCLTVTVNRNSAGLTQRSEILRDMAICEGQRGHVHILPPFPNRLWVMQPAIFQQAEATRCTITYVWLSDPGNGPMALPSSVPEAKRKLCHYPRTPRPPWHYYQVVPSQGLIQDDNDIQKFRPEILHVDMFPPQGDEGNVANPFYDPAGWAKLPGRIFR